MQKINREALNAAVKSYNEFGPMSDEDGFSQLDILHEAAAILLEITDPEFVPTKEMQIAGRDCKFNGKKSTNPKDVFRAMIKELTE